MDYSFKDMYDVYNACEDDISKEIYLARINYSVTHNIGCITNVGAKYKNVDADTQILTEQIFNNECKIVIWGAGIRGKVMASSFGRERVVAFIDSYRKEGVEDETKLPIYTLENYLKNYQIVNTKFIISLFNDESALQVEQQLLDVGIFKGDIIKVGRDWRNNTSQYFDVFVPRKNEVFVDCGCFDGRTAFGFAAWCNESSYDKIICFEPDSQLYEKCSKTLEKLKDCYLYPYGISDKNGKVSFLANGKEDACIVESDNLKNISTIETVKLDTFLKDERITFIKMDIEGAEYGQCKAGV